MKTDERMAERITHLEGDIKILKSEVQAVLVDLRDRYLEADNPFNVPSAPAVPQQVVVFQGPAANEARSDTELHSGSVEKEGKDKTEETTGGSDAGRETHSEKAKQEGRDKTQEPMGGSEAGRDTQPATTREDVKQTRRPEEVSGNTGAGRDYIRGRDIDMIRIVGLANWAEESVKKLGYQKTEAILDVAEIMGLLSPEIKQIMTKLINVDSDGKSQSFSVRVFLDSLVKITTLLGKDNKTEAALLSILSREDDPWIR